MMNDEEAPDSPEDDADIALLQQVLDAIENAGVPNVIGVGPVGPGGVTVTVSQASVAQSSLPSAIQVTLPDGTSSEVKLDIVADERSPRLLSGPVPPPFQHSGPLMGGDPLWNNDATQWGTISFAVAQGSSIQIEGNACENRAITCNHVLDFPTTTTASTTRYPDSMYLKWNIVPPLDDKWLDLAGAEIGYGVPYKPLEVRGLGIITGVRRSRKGRRVSKYGATTGLTSGVDLGWAKKQLHFPDKTKYWVKVISGYFAREGDSGAAVLDANRNLVGLVVSGIPGALDQTYILQASRTPGGPHTKDRSRFVISGL